MSAGTASRMVISVMAQHFADGLADRKRTGQAGAFDAEQGDQTVDAVALTAATSGFPSEAAPVLSWTQVSGRTVGLAGNAFVAPAVLESSELVFEVTARAGYDNWLKAAKPDEGDDWPLPLPGCALFPWPLFVDCPWPLPLWPSLFCC